MRTRTLTNMILDVRQRANMENSTFVTDAEITEYLNQELAELWGRLALNEGQPHIRSTTTISVVSNTALYNLPSDFWRMQSITANLNGITGVLSNFNEVDRGYLSSPLIWGVRSPVQYRIQANQIEFLPSTQAFTATMYYTPCQPRLVTGSDTFDGFNGYEIAAIYGAVAHCLVKEEGDPSFFVGEKQRIFAHIDSLAPSRDAFGPERVADTSTMSSWWGWGWR